MDVTLAPDLLRLVEREVADGQFTSANQLIAEALRRFLNDRKRAGARIAALRRIGNEVDRHGFYEESLPNSQ